MGLFLDLMRPVCGFCDGRGGFTSGYYEPEWSGCPCCDPKEERMDEPVTRVWRWQWWAFRFREWRHDRWIEKQMAKSDREENSH
jgi:hypothetical protein